VRCGKQVIYESYPWKQDLLRRKRLLFKYNSTDSLEKNFDAAYTVIEKSIFYSAFIIRKLIDCGGKISDEADQYTLRVEQIRPNTPINKMQRWLDEDSHDWENTEYVMVRGRDICNWLIHSYIFCLEFEENRIVASFYLSSDYDRNKVLYKVSLEDWVSYMNFIATDDVVEISMHYNEKIKDYKYIRKERGIRK
jgi:hypothetical protein